MSMWFSRTWTKPIPKMCAMWSVWFHLGESLRLSKSQDIDSVHSTFLFPNASSKTLLISFVLFGNWPVCGIEWTFIQNRQCFQGASHCCRFSAGWIFLLDPNGCTEFSHHIRSTHYKRCAQVHPQRLFGFLTWSQRITSCSDCSCNSAYHCFDEVKVWLLCFLLWFPVSCPIGAASPTCLSISGPVCRRKRGDGLHKWNHVRVRIL